MEQENSKLGAKDSATEIKSKGAEMRMCQEVRVSRGTKKPLAKKQPAYGISNSQPQKDRRAKKSCFYLLGEVLYLKGTYVVFIYIHIKSM